MLKHFLIFCMVVLLLCSCSKSEKEEITFTSWGSITEVKIINKIIENYEKDNPNIKIKFIHIPQNYFQKVHLLFASSTAPDVLFINNLYLPLYSKYLEDLSEQTELDKFYPQSVQAMSVEGKLLAVPRDISNFVIYYNKNIVGNINDNWSFEDFKRIMKLSTNEKHYGISFERDVFYATPYIKTLGYKEGIEFYKNLEGQYAPTPAQVGSSTLAQMFLDEKLGMYMSGRWMYPKISETAKFPFGVAVFPGKIDADASGWAISKSSKHKDAAKDFVNYLSSKKNIDYFTSTGLIVPARKDSAILIKEKAFIKSISISEPNITDKNYNKTRDEQNKQIWEF